MPEGERLPEQLLTDPMRLGWPPGAITLRHEWSRHGPIEYMPRRLVNAGLADRPWPRHSIYAKFIGLEYAQWVPPVHPEESETINIVGDRTIARDERLFTLGSLQIALINAGLIAGDFCLNSAELEYLIVTNRKLIGLTQDRLEKRMGKEMFEKRYVAGKERFSRLHPRLRFIDLRQENKKGIPEFIG
jgi:hypothetical protein